MIRAFIAGFLILHGLTHAWFVVLAQRLVPYDPKMGWTGESWLLTGPLGDPTTRMVASVLFALSMLLFVGGGIGLLAAGSWARALILAAAVVSIITLALFWDGGADLLVQKGLIGLIIDVVVLVLFARAYPFIL